MGGHDNTQAHLSDALVEFAPDAWERFEHAVDMVSKSGPQHRPRKYDSSLSEQFEDFKLGVGALVKDLAARPFYKPHSPDFQSDQGDE
jgi:hypothetical protein